MMVLKTSQNPVRLSHRSDVMVNMFFEYDLLAVVLEVIWLNVGFVLRVNFRVERGIGFELFQL